MSKIGVEVRIDVTKLDKARFFKGEKGTYLSMTTFIDIDNKDEYENNGFITQSRKKDEEIQMPIVGNVKVFWRDDGGQAPNTQGATDTLDDDIPF